MAALAPLESGTLARPYRWRAALCRVLQTGAHGDFEPQRRQPLRHRADRCTAQCASIRRSLPGACGYRSRGSLSDGALSPITSRGASTDQVVCLCWRHHVCRYRYGTGSLVSAPFLPGVTLIWPVLFLSAASTIPVATGIAILKYRLYDIDRIINRTLVYGSLTALLALVY